MELLVVNSELPVGRGVAVVDVPHTGQGLVNGTRRLEHEHGGVGQVEVDILSTAVGGGGGTNLEDIGAAVDIVKSILLTGESVEVAMS